jgi:PKD repeat protein
MTWGRQNGDATFCPTYPEVCTYLSMDSTLREKYTELAQEAGAEISPVSAVWRYLRQNHSTIQLYTADGSHPSVAGSYAAACTFYTAIFKKDPNAITFDSSLNAADALAIRQATKTVVYDSLPQWNYQHQPHSNFQYTIGSGTNEVIFSPINFGVAQDYLWDFGDGNTSTSSNPTHSYATDGTYTVTLTTSICNLQGMSNSITDTVISFCSHTPNIFSNKTWLCNYDTLWTQTADTYQWYNGGVALPEMQRFLADYQQYNNFSFTVSSTVNGCSELSQVFLASPQWSGYYFDAAFGGDPCVGDTGIVAVLNGSGFTGTETIRWFKDGQPLPTFDNKDTLFVYTSGNYKGYVVDQSSNCPLDTTLIGPLSYQCLSTPEPLPEEEIVIYPNPASKVIGLELPVGLNTQKVYIYSANGLLIQKTILPSSQQVDISRLSPGLYYLLLDSKPESALKFIKQ